ncbi:MAG: flagellar assembly protein FliW [Eubacterium sp.]|nr:flagellar assembly protein FliW [Eubacterium sp.]
MKADTRLFGPIEIEDEKIIEISQGIIGFPDLKHFTLIYDSERETQSAIRWLQSMDDGDIAMPVIAPGELLPDYRPTVNNELLADLGELTSENTYLLVTVRVPENIEELSVNLKAPIVINTDTNKGSQVIVEDDFEVRHKIYDLIRDGQQKAGE